MAHGDMVYQYDRAGKHIDYYGDYEETSFRVKAGSKIAVSPLTAWILPG